MTGPLGVPMVIAEPGHEIGEGLRFLEQLVDEAGWDQPNRLFMFRRQNRDMLTVSEGPPFDTEPMGFFREFTLFLLGKPETAKRLLGNNPGFAGLAVAFESWSVEQPDDPAAQAQLDQDRAARRLHQRPDRVESRCVMAVMLDGRTGMVQHHRGQSAELVAQGSFEGTVLETLEAFVAILALLAPEYCSG